MSELKENEVLDREAFGSWDCNPKVIAVLRERKWPEKTTPDVDFIG